MPKAARTKNLETIVRRVFSSHPQTFKIKLWDGTTFTIGNSKAQFTLVFRSPKVFRRILLAPNALTAGEAYIKKEFDIEGDLFEAIRLMEVFELPPLTLSEKLRYFVRLSLL